VIFLLDAHDDEDRALRVQLNVRHHADLHAGEPDRLSLLDARAPLEPRIQRVATREAATHEPDRSEHGNDGADREQDADENLVASFHNGIL
jgi:hypothetical protein